MTAHTSPATEAEQGAAGKYNAGFFAHLAPQRVKQGFVRFGPPARQVPIFAIAADQDGLLSLRQTAAAPWGFPVVESGLDAMPRANPDRP